MLFFSINQSIVSEVHPQGLSLNHFIITFSVPPLVHNEEQRVSYVAHNYSKADWEGIYNFVLNCNIHEYYHRSDVETVWSTFLNLCCYSNFSSTVHC